MAYRTHNCNQLTFDQLNQTVSLAGWVDTIRDHGGVIFVDLRDEYGVTQVVFHDDALLKGVRKESVISVTGKVVKRDPETVNKKDRYRRAGSACDGSDRAGRMYPHAAF